MIGSADGEYSSHRISSAILLSLLNDKVLLIVISLLRNPPDFSALKSATCLDDPQVSGSRPLGFLRNTQQLVCILMTRESRDGKSV